MLKNEYSKQIGYMHKAIIWCEYFGQGFVDISLEENIRLFDSPFNCPQFLLKKQDNFKNKTSEKLLPLFWSSTK